MREHDKTEHREVQREKEVGQLHQFERDAVLSGTKLGLRDRLKAAFHLTRAWNAANKAGLRKTDFQDAVFVRLKRPHGKRQEFRLTNWTLRRGEDPFKQDLLEAYQGKSTPQQSLEPYLKGIEVAAEHCEVDPDDWKLDMTRDLTLWARPTTRPDVIPEDDRPAESLAIFLKVLCDKLGAENNLAETLQAIDKMGCRWEMFNERIVPEAESSSMVPLCSPLGPDWAGGEYFEEAFPYPSIPMLYVPYLVAEKEFVLAPEALLGPSDAERILNAGSLHGETQNRTYYNAIKSAPGSRQVSGKLIWSRELRLCLVPNGHDGFEPAIETRPRVEINFDGFDDNEEIPFAGRHHVIGGYEPELDRPLFYSQTDDGGHVWPSIHDQEGKPWRIVFASESEDLIGADRLTVRDPETTGWCFDEDPVRSPGEWSLDPYYLTYTQATAPYLRHWLTEHSSLGGEHAICPWARVVRESPLPQDRWNRDVPPFNELNFPEMNHATWIECCLHNGLIEEAFQSAIDRLKDQAGTLQASWHHARERHSNALLKRWKTDKTKGKTNQ